MINKKALKEIAIHMILTGIVLILSVLAQSCTKEPLEQEPYCKLFDYVTVKWKVYNIKSHTNKTLEGTFEELEAQGWAFHPNFGHSGMWRKTGNNNGQPSMWHVTQEIKDYICVEE